MDTCKLIKLQEILDAQKNGARIQLWDNYDNSFTDIDWEYDDVDGDTYDIEQKVFVGVSAIIQKV